MSANIVNERCLSDIINFLSYEERFWKDKTYGRCSKLLKKQGYNLSTDNGRNRLFQDMLHLNVQAVESIYPDDELYNGGYFNMINDSKDYSLKCTSSPEIYHAVISIKYWLYGMYEGDMVEEKIRSGNKILNSSMLYVTFQKIMDLILYSIIAKTPRAKFWRRYDETVKGVNAVCN